MNALDLPAGCQWSDSVDDAVTVLDTGRIPLLWPDDAERARRWVQVMRWYTPCSHTPRTAPTGAVVISLGPTETLGHLAATALNRPHHHVTTAATAADLPAPRRVLLVATGPDCALSSLAPALDFWARTQTLVGLLTGRDTAGIVFSLAKILASHSSIRTSPQAKGNNALIDGPAGRVRQLFNTSERLRFTDLLTNDWRTILIDAHGSGAHAWVGPHVLCGLTAADERTGSGHIIPRGCTSSRCKLSPDGTLRPLHPHQLRTASHPDSGAELAVRTPPCLHPGHPLNLSAELNASQPTHGVLAIQLRSRSASQHAYTSHPPRSLRQQRPRHLAHPGRRRG